LGGNGKTHWTQNESKIDVRGFDIDDAALIYVRSTRKKPAFSEIGVCKTSKFFRNGTERRHRLQPPYGERMLKKTTQRRFIA
jgi:hypothetical protein